ncbi:MAG: ribonuclease P protein component [Rhodospirillaceae bacterium]|jgi:ribonuclease P protein component
MGSRLGKLKSRPQFLNVSRSRQKFVASSLILQTRAHGDLELSDETVEPIRVGYTVSRKVGKAVVRNRIKRRLRAAVEEVLPVHAAGDRDFVLIGRRSAYAKPFPAIVADLKRALQGVDAYRERTES